MYTAPGGLVYLGNPQNIHNDSYPWLREGWAMSDASLQIFTVGVYSVLLFLIYSSASIITRYHYEKGDPLIAKKSFGDDKPATGPDQKIPTIRMTWSSTNR